MTDFAPSMPHGELDEVFPDVFVVTGTMRGEFFGSTWQFSRNMTVVRDGGALTLINAVRLDEAGLSSLERLGTVTNLVRLGSMHGHDDAFYLARYSPEFWALRGMPEPPGARVRELRAGGAMPFSDCSLFQFQTTRMPEGILRLDREGGILIACDSLQNWVAPDEYFAADTVETMTKMGFFTRANLGPAWIHVNEPGADDFRRLREVPFKHALCGHGSPLRETAMQDYAATFGRLFGV
jgi:hypothetical protein